MQNESLNATSEEAASKPPKIVIRGGNTGVYINGRFYSSYDSACPRTILLRTLKIDQQLETLDDDYSVFVLGREFETYFKTTQMLEEFDEEKLLTFDIDENVTFEGHADLISPTTVYELKSLSSVNVYTQVFKKNKPKLSNIIQLIGYMMAADRYVGKLVYGSYLEVVDYKTLIVLNKTEVLELINDFKPELKMFDVTITPGVGTIRVNGIPLEFDVFAITTFWKEMVNFLAGDETTQLPARPLDISKKRDTTTCFFCNKRAICDSINDYATKKEFLTATEKYINKRSTVGE